MPMCTVFRSCDAAGASFVGKNHSTPTAIGDPAITELLFADEHARRFVRVKQGDLIAMNDAVLGACA